MSQQPRHVRIGIVWRGQIVGERVLCRRTAVSIGLRPDATIQIAASEHPEFPAYMDLLRLSGGRYHLVLPRDPNARVTLRGTPVNNVTVDIDGQRCLPVEAAAGGSLVAGDLCVMFQFVAGYSQPMAVRERTVLRLGLVHDERLISDRLFHEGDRISVGNHKGDDIVLDHDYTGPSLAFRRHGDGTATLSGHKGISLRMALPGDNPVDADELLRLGRAQLKGEQLRGHLPLGTRGRVRMGPYTILFQVLRQRVEVPVLPKRGWSERIGGALFRDPVWTACLALWFALAGVVSVQAYAVHQTVGRYLQDIQPPEDDDLVQRQHLVEIEVLTPEIEKPEAPPLEPAPQPEKLREKKPPKPAAKEPKRRPQSIGKTAEPDKARRNPRDVIATRTIAGAITGPGASSKMFADHEGPGGDVQKAFGGGSVDANEPGPATGLKLADANGGGTYEKTKVKHSRFKRSSASNKLAHKKTPRGPKPPVLSPGLFVGDAPGEKKNAIRRVIARKQNAVRRCYESALRKNATLQSKVTVRFVIGTAGTITSVTITGASGDFRSCIERKFRAIRGLPLLSAPTSFKQAYVFTRN